MKNQIENLLLQCSGLDFGLVELSDGEKEFCSQMNDEVISMCRSLPESTQADALFLLMRCFHIPIGQDLSFFMDYHVPAWSIIYWLIQSMHGEKALKPKDTISAKTAHGMALLLHPIDDHLNDSELPATHLTLLVRSQLWMRMNNALKCMAADVERGTEIVKGFINDYYSSITSSQEVISLNSYCERFRKQMATGFIVPVLIMKKMSADDKFISAVKSAYASFGIAWRLLDDINDLEDDMLNGTKSGVYFCLPDNIKYHWDRDTADRNGIPAELILDSILENNIVEKIENRICKELTSAATVLNRHNLSGLADEFHALSITRSRRQNQV